MAITQEAVDGGNLAIQYFVERAAESDAALASAPIWNQHGHLLDQSTQTLRFLPNRFPEQGVPIETADLEHAGRHAFLPVTLADYIDSLITKYFMSVRS